MADNTLSIAQVLNYVNSFHEQCRNMVRDTVRLLRDNHQLYLVHQENWDYAMKPNDRFLTQDYSSVRRAWMTFAPSGAIQQGAIFFFDFFHPRSLITPSLMFGAAYPGSSGFDLVDRWTSYNTIVDAEKDDQTVSVSHNGPLTIVKGAMPKRYEEAAFVRLPLEAIKNAQTLERVVVAPLAALLRGDRTIAINLLEGAPTESWPSMLTGSTEEEVDDSEKA